MTAPADRNDALRGIQSLARSCQGQTAHRIAHLFREDDGAKRFKAGWELVEALMIELLDRLNSALAAEDLQGGEAERIRRATFKFGDQDKHVAFGERRQALLEFSESLRKPDGLRLQAFEDVQSLLQKPLEDAVATLVWWLKGARTGRQRFNIPPDSIDDYARDEVARSRAKLLLSPAEPDAKDERPYFVDLLSELNMWRNADSHVDRDGAPEKRWLQQVAQSALWWDKVGSALFHGLSALLLWSPVMRVLSRTQRLALRGYVQDSPETWSAQVVERSDLDFIPRVVTGRGATLAADRAEWWVAVATSAKEPNRAICPCVNWPVVPSWYPNAERDHQASVARKLLTIGYLGEAQRLELTEQATSQLIPTERSRKLRHEASEVVKRAGRGDAASERRLVEWVGASDVAAYPPGELTLRRERAILLDLDEQWPLTPMRLSEIVGVSIDEMQAILRSPSLAARIHRRTDGDGESLRPKWDELEEARSVLALVRPLKKASEPMRRLADCVLRLARLLDEDFALSDGEAEPEPEVRTSASVSLRLDTGLLSATTVPELLHSLVRWADGRGQRAALVASLPWVTADGQELIGVSAEPGGGGSPVAGIRVASGPRRSLALYTIEEQCSRLGWASLSPSTVVSRDAPAGVPSLMLDVRASDEAPWVMIGGDSVREFLSRLFWWMEEARCVDVSRLPISTGRSRYILNSEPVHSTGKSFLEPIHMAPGLYLEGHQSYASALSAAQKLCAAFGVGMREDGASAADAGPVRRTADSAGVAEAFGIRFDAGLRMGLAPRYFSQSVMFAPATNLARFAFFLRPQPRRHGGVLEVSWKPEAFAEFLGMGPERAAQFLGDTRQEIVDTKGAQQLADRIGEMMAGEVEADRAESGAAPRSRGPAAQDDIDGLGDAGSGALPG